MSQLTRNIVTSNPHDVRDIWRCCGKMNDEDKKYFRDVSTQHWNQGWPEGELWEDSWAVVKTVVITAWDAKEPAARVSFHCCICRSSFQQHQHFSKCIFRISKENTGDSRKRLFLLIVADTVPITCHLVLFVPPVLFSSSLFWWLFILFAVGDRAHLDSYSTVKILGFTVPHRTSRHRFDKGRGIHYLTYGGQH